jgi:hypothetical protein
VEVGCVVGFVIVTVPASRVSLNLRVSAASNETEWRPAGSVDDHVWTTPLFQLLPPALRIRWAVPSMTTETWSGAEPSRLRYLTAKAIVVEGVPVRGETLASISFVGPSTARTGATSAKATNRAAPSASSGRTADRPSPVRVRIPFDTLIFDLRAGKDARDEATMLARGGARNGTGVPP